MDVWSARSAVRVGLISLHEYCNPYTSRLGWYNYCVLLAMIIWRVGTPPALHTYAVAGRARAMKARFIRACIFVRVCNAQPRARKQGTAAHAFTSKVYSRAHVARHSRARAYAKYTVGSS